MKNAKRSQYMYYFYFLSAGDRAADEENNETKLVSGRLDAFVSAPFRPRLLIIGCFDGWLARDGSFGPAPRSTGASIEFGTVLIEPSRMSLLVRGASAKLRAVARSCKLQLHVDKQSSEDRLSLISKNSRRLDLSIQKPKPQTNRAAVKMKCKNGTACHANTPKTAN